MNMQKIKRPKLSVWEKINRSTWILATLLLISWSAMFVMAKDKQQLRESGICENNQKNKTEAVAGAEADTLSAMEQLANIMVLPDEDPAVATVKNAYDLKAKESFFAEAKNGDKVLIFSKMSILFRPDTGRILNIGILQNALTGSMAGQEAADISKNNLGDDKTGSPTEAVEQEAADQPAVLPAKPTIDIRNGSWIAGLASDWSNLLKDEGYEVQSAANASRHDYSRTILVNQSDHDTRALFEITGAEARDELPRGEKSSLADIVLILSKESNF